MGACASRESASSDGDASHHSSQLSMDATIHSVNVAEGLLYSSVCSGEANRRKERGRDDSELATHQDSTVRKVDEASCVEHRCRDDDRSLRQSFNSIRTDFSAELQHNRESSLRSSRRIYVDLNGAKRGASCHRNADLIDHAFQAAEDYIERSAATSGRWTRF